MQSWSVLLLSHAFVGFGESLGTVTPDAPSNVEGPVAPYSCRGIVELSLFTTGWAKVEETVVECTTQGGALGARPKTACAHATGTYGARRTEKQRCQKQSGTLSLTVPIAGYGFGSHIDPHEQQARLGIAATHEDGQDP